MMNSYRPKECDSFAPLLVHSLKKKKNSIYQTPGIVRGTGHKATEKIKFTDFMKILVQVSTNCSLQTKSDSLLIFINKFYWNIVILYYLHAVYGRVQYFTYYL